jgi:hypothetical protein
VRAQTALSSAFAKRLDAPRLVAPLLDDDHILPFHSAVQVLRYVASPDCLEGLAQAPARLPYLDSRDRDRLKPRRELHWAYSRITGRSIDKPEDAEEWLGRFRGLPVPWRFGVEEHHDTWAALILRDDEPTTAEPFRCLLYLSTGPPMVLAPEPDWARRDVGRLVGLRAPTPEEIARRPPGLFWYRLDNAFLPESPVGPLPQSRLEAVLTSAYPSTHGQQPYTVVWFESGKAPELPGWYQVRLIASWQQMGEPPLPRDVLPWFVYVRAGEGLEKEIDERVTALGAMEELSGEEIREHLERLLEIRSARVGEPLLKVLEFANERDERGEPKNVSGRSLDLLCRVLGMTADPQVIAPLLQVKLCWDGDVI